MAEPLKYYYSQEYIDHLAANVACVYPSFDKDEFVQNVFDSHWDTRELKDRMYHIPTTLKAYLPSSIPEALDILCRAASQPMGTHKHLGMLNMCFPAFVELFGLDYEDASMKALHHLTRFSSSEFAIRPFIKKHPQKILAIMQDWAHDPNEHVRRLSSEGCRPRLPWAMALDNLKKDPTPIFSILEILKDDKSTYVRKSVSNNLNDISKDHPDLVYPIAKRWLHEHHNRSMIKHGCRTLLKTKHQDTLRLFGFSDDLSITHTILTLSSLSYSIGQTLEFSLEFEVNTPAFIRFEYGIDFVTKQQKYSHKLFFLKDSKCHGLQRITKSHALTHYSTRTLYPGMHHITITANGSILAKASFELTQE